MNQVFIYMIENLVLNKKRTPLLQKHNCFYDSVFTIWVRF